MNEFNNELIKELPDELKRKILEAARLIKSAKRVTAFSGAGISVESGIPPFRGENGLWNKMSPDFIEINHFLARPEESWVLIKEIFYDYFGKAKPNDAHIALAQLEKLNLLHSIITQNIDNLHTVAGSETVYEFHGNSRDLVCLKCNYSYPVSTVNFNNLPPLCKKCRGLLKPDFVFFGEPIPEPAGSNSFLDAKQSDLFLIVGTTGEIMPASVIPRQAKLNNAKIIEINIAPSAFTDSITDIFLQGKATVILKHLLDACQNQSLNP
ncbi:MAG: NAD-dependent deacylase [Deltaproteobacteria bacterium]|nr:NAD-dependent deacylase [Deltaproteobacteria bacterium]